MIACSLAATTGESGNGGGERRERGASFRHEETWGRAEAEVDPVGSGRASFDSWMGVMMIDSSLNAMRGEDGKDGGDEGIERVGEVLDGEGVEAV